MVRLRALNIAAVSSGRELAPGTPDYERDLQTLAEHLSEDELAAGEALNAR